MESYTPVWGDPSYIYKTRKELVDAVIAYPNRFSPETHDLVTTILDELVQSEQNEPRGN